MKNYYQTVERRFTIGKLEIRPLNNNDTAILIITALALTVMYTIGNLNPEKRALFLFIISFSLSSMITDMPFGMPLGLRLRNVSFSIIWLILCGTVPLFYDTAFALAPLLLFLTYHVMRLIFWRLYDREFIPYQLGRGKLFRFVSKVEGHGGYKEDRAFMRVFVFLSFCIFMGCVFALVGKDLSTL